MENLTYEEVNIAYEALLIFIAHVIDMNLCFQRVRQFVRYKITVATKSLYKVVDYAIF